MGPKSEADQRLEKTRADFEEIKENLKSARRYNREARILSVLSIIISILALLKRLIL